MLITFVILKLKYQIIFNIGPRYDNDMLSGMNSLVPNVVIISKIYILRVGNYHRLIKAHRVGNYSRLLKARRVGNYPRLLKAHRVGNYSRLLKAHRVGNYPRLIKAHRVGNYPRLLAIKESSLKNEFLWKRYSLAFGLVPRMRWFFKHHRKVGCLATLAPGVSLMIFLLSLKL